MSRSKKYPIHVVTNKIDKSLAHKRVRKFVKQKLSTMDLEDIPIIDIEADTRDIGAEEYGTKFGYKFMDGLSEEEREEFKEDQKKASRK